MGARRCGSPARRANARDPWSRLLASWLLVVGAMRTNRTRGVVMCAVVLAGGCSEDAGSAGDGSSAEATGAPSGSDGSSGAAADPTGSGGDAPAVVYWRDVKPIVDARCGACHSDDGVAPFALASYTEVASYGEAMVASVQSGQMPPWPAADDCTEYLFDPSLDEVQIQTLVDWVELGTPEGDPADVGEPLPLGIAELPRVDFEVAMAAEHTPMPPDGGLDEHRCFLVDWPETSDVYVTGYAVIPGNRKVVHHLVARIVGPDDVAALQEQDAMDAEDGWPCEAGSGMSGAGGPLLGVWVPGSGANVLPEGTGMEVVAGSKVMLNMHYNVLMGDTAPDRTRVAFMVEDEVDDVGISQFITDPTWPLGDNMLIEAGDPDSVHTYDKALPAMRVHSVGLHMHTLGAAGSLVIEHADGTRSCAVDIPRWDFDWQLEYRLATAIDVAAGDRVVMQCRFDNSPEHQQVVDGVLREPEDVTWGEDTFDEMCLGFVYLTK